MHQLPKRFAMPCLQTMRPMVKTDLLRGRKKLKETSVLYLIIWVDNMHDIERLGDVSGVCGDNNDDIEDV